ncbi:MBL fold metallo-hydrolase [Muricoccus aerilatus]|uniref:MBL fold metallo-hydrolase n=1 Tax=Muricoccus aerilatus TaxID=452982 RepID=UPI0006936C39|nr:MBL fold metallo-hydrolase [Roseomonas aerilata]
MAAADPEVQAFFDDATNTVTYLVWDAGTGAAAVIDPVLDWDHRAGGADTRSADAVLQVLEEKGLRLEWVLETHAHADHLTAAPYVKQRTGAPIGIGARIVEVQNIFRPVFDARDLRPGGADFDRLFADGERFRLGDLEVEVLHVPGHTPADVAYRIGNAAFVGDTLFMPDAGTARADFPGGDAHELYRSIQRLLALPDGSRIFVCHDYKAPGRDQFAWEATVAEQRAHNIHVGGGRGEAEYVEMRHKRDATLSAPTLLLPSIQVNIRAGRFPGGEGRGVTFLRIPVAGRGIVQQDEEERS